MMTDKEIVKALEYCCEDTSICPEECSYYKCKGDYITCFEKMQKDALDLINRQQAEIESWKRLYENTCAELNELLSLEREIKEQAIKEFAEKLKADVQVWIDVSGEYVLYEVLKDIDNFAKELVCADNET